MDNDELVATILDKIRLAVMEGMAEHIQEKHAPLEAELRANVADLRAEIKTLDKQVDIWRGALVAFGLVFSLALAVLKWTTR